MKPGIRTVAGLAAAALFVAPLAGCGSNSVATKAGNPSAASTATEQAQSPRTSQTDGAATELTEADFADVITTAMARKKTAHMKMSFGTVLNLEGDVAYSGSTSATRMSLDSAGMSGVVIYTDGAIYLSMKGATPQGKFIKISRDDPAMGKLLGQLNGVGPEGSLTAMKEGVRDFEYVGPDTIDGVPVMKYGVTVNLAAAAKAMGSAPDQLEGAPKSVTYDLYVDKDNLMRRLVLELMGQKMQMDVTDWGKPVTVEAPPASDIVAAPAPPG